MIVKEYRIVLPLSIEEFQIGQLYTVAEASKNETGGGEGIEVLKNEPFDNLALVDGELFSGQFTHKIYRIQSKVPGWVRAIAPHGALEIHETAWNAYPVCKTECTNPAYMKENFRLSIRTVHLPDRGETANALNLPTEELNKRQVEFIDIAYDKMNPREYRAAWDPQRFCSRTTKRGPLQRNWQKTADPVMCCYKLVTVEFKWFPIGFKIEHFIQKAEKHIFLNFHRQVFCTMDEWFGLTLAHIRHIEDDTKRDLDRQRAQGDVRSQYVPEEEA